LNTSNPPATDSAYDKALSPSNIFLLGLTYFLYFGHVGVIVPYLGVFLDGRGYSSQQIGELFAIITLARILGPNLWSYLADKVGKGLLMLRIGALLTCVSTGLAYVSNEFWLITASLAGVMIFATAILPQIEVVTMDCVKGDPQRYSRLRMWGSMGFIAFTVAMGAVLDVTSTEMVLYGTTAILFAVFCSTLAITSVQHDVHPHTVTDGKNEWRKALSMPFICFIISAGLLQLSMGPFYSFFALYSAELGYTGAQTGIFLALGVVAEIGIFLVAGKLIHRFGIKWLIIVSMWLTSIRWLMLAYTPDTWWLLSLSQLLHAFSFGVTHAASVSFIHHFFAKRFHSQGQALYVSLAFGLGGAVGNYGAGLLWLDGEGAVLTFVCAALAAMLGGIVMMFAHHPVLTHSTRAAC
jgi:PPP family 3-phenylpropionic acid transporter